MYRKFYLRATPANRKAYFEWRKNHSWENHSTISFIAGYNAAMRDVKNKKRKKEKRIT